MISLVESILKSVGAGKEAVGIGDWKVGMILSAPYVYSSRYNYYYEIVAVKGKSTVFVKELDKERVTDDGYGQNGTEKPILGKYIHGGQEIKARIDKWGDLKIQGCRAHEWNGKPEQYYTD